MNDETEKPAAEQPTKFKRKAAHRRKPAKRRSARSAPEGVAATAPKAGLNLTGMTAKMCPEACSEAHCIISTVGVCKHPHLSADSGCGPVTMRNRELAKKYLKRQQAEV